MADGSPEIADPLVHAHVGLPQLTYKRFLLGGELCGKRCSDSFVQHQQLVIDIESRSLCFTTVSNHGLLSSWTAIMSRKRRRLKGTPRAQGVPWKEHP
jgi:hypothetical protein